MLLCHAGGWDVGLVDGTGRGLLNASENKSVGIWVVGSVIQ